MATPARGIRKTPKRSASSSGARGREPSGRAPSRSPLPMPAALLDAAPEPDVVDVPARTVLAVDGAGPPDGDAFRRSVGALYGAAYGLKFARKKEGRGEFKIGPLEGRWWAEGARSRASAPPIDQWRWRLRMAVPDAVDEHALADVIQAATMKKGGKLERKGHYRAPRPRWPRKPVD